MRPSPGSRSIAKSHSNRGQVRKCQPIRVMSAFPLETDAPPCPGDVGFVPTPDSRTAANTRVVAAPYSITSSARASSVGGTSRSSVFAVLRLMTASNLID